MTKRNLNIIHFVVPIFLGLLLTLLLIFFTRFKSPSQINWHLFLAIGSGIFLIWHIFYRFFTAKLKKSEIGFSTKILMRALLTIFLGVIVFDLVYVIIKLVEISFYGSIDFIQPGHIIAASGVGLFSVLVVGGIQSAVFLVNYWVEERISHEKTEKELHKSKLFLLKQQLNPHFIFNSFSTLDALIHSNKNKASNFLHRLSHFYHLILSTYEKNLIPLKDEIELVNHYFKLLGTRFQDDFHIDMSLGENWEKYKVPPLSIQSLVENAVKHNKIGKDMPLILKMSIDDHTIKVVNNKQKKSSSNLLTGTGLTNLRNRLKHFNKELHIRETSKIFEVRFELIV